MLLIIEFILVCVAWNKGWKWRTLIPFGIGCLIMIISGFLIGLGNGLSGGSATTEQLMSVIKPIAFVVQICLIIVLAYMAKNKRKLPVTIEAPILDNHPVEVPIQMGTTTPSPDREVMNKRLKQLGGLFILVLVFIVIKQFFFKIPSNDKEVVDSKPSIDKELMDFANEVNKSCPAMIDQETRLDNVNAFEHNTLQYNYTLINQIKDSLVISNLTNHLGPLILNKIKTSPELKDYRDKNVTWIYTYFDKNGIFILRLTFTPERYK